MYAKVLVEIGVKSVDKEFIYIIPDSLKDKVKVGVRVLVNFGKMSLEGFVMDIINDYQDNYELKEITSVIDDTPIINSEMLELGKYISNKTLCSKISAYQVMLPKALKASKKTNIKIKQKRFIILNKTKEDINKYLKTCKYKKQKDILSRLLTKNKLEITKLDSSINTLLKHNLIRFEYEEDFRYKYETNNQDKRVVLNEEQMNVVNKVIDNKSKTYLLYGVTGSGKTEVYMNIIERNLNKGKEAIMLVPEISLTPQIVDRFVTRFGNQVAILHSGLSDVERYDEYRKIVNKQVKIVVGARSAIFAPFTNLGVIIIDEEHSQTYKQENHPRYHAQDIAIVRSKYHNCPVILGSATPSLESFARAGNQVYELLILTKRANGLSLPKVTIVDMKKEIKRGNYDLSEVLINKIKHEVENNKQVILLLNRRGYSSMITCSNCGHVEKCPNCDISFTYHKTSNTLRCHYCNYVKKNITRCPNCDNQNLKDFGLGTQKLEEELNKIFNYKVVRMDMDTTSKKGAHQKIVEDFGQHKYDILLGTQMIAKGLDFPLVTLVGVINADNCLNVPDFRSSERTFELLCQVSGRAGRSEYPGEVIIQTFNPDHYSINYAKEHNYLSFYKKEMQIRKELNYSPYYYITLVKIYSKDYDLGFEHANKISNYLRKNKEENTVILGPTMANVFKINNVYNYQCIIKYKKDSKLKDLLINIDKIYKDNTKINVEIDVDPIRL